MNTKLEPLKLKNTEKFSSQNDGLNRVVEIIRYCKEQSINLHVEGHLSVLESDNGFDMNPYLRTINKLYLPFAGVVGILFSFYIGNNTYSIEISNTHEFFDAETLYYFNKAFMENEIGCIVTT